MQKIKNINFRSVNNAENVAKYVSKDVLFQQIANEIFSSPNDAEGQEGKLNMVSQDDAMILHLKDGRVAEVSKYTCATAASFKEEYGVSLKEAICKSAFIEYSTADGTQIWAKNASEYIKYGWEVIPEEKPAPVTPEPTTQEVVEENTDPVIDQEVEQAAAPIESSSEEPIGDPAPEQPAKKSKKSKK